jgi:two-component system phosphate regulon sensor histidine kinase PhoR
VFIKILVSNFILILIFSVLIFAFYNKSLEDSGDYILLQRDLANILIASLIILTIASILVSVLLYRNLIKSLNEVGNTARRIASGDLDTRIKPEYGKEVNSLASAINYMLDRIKTYIDTLIDQNTELNNAFSAIEDGLVVLDASGRIIIANTGFKRYAQAVSPEKRFYWEVVRSIELDELVKDIIANKTTESKELVINEKTLLCKGIYLIFRNEIVLTFNDITEIKNIEKIKRDFVSNISHELRTPLTSIKGYAETLEETVNEEGKRYLDIILRNTERLINIVQDLLLLSELEEVKSLNIEELDLKALLENVMKIFDQKAKDKGLEISVSAEDNFPIIEADAFKLEQVFINILDNAVKYTERGEIAISLKNEIDDVIIEIEDTGIGMPQKDLVRIFERFYVVDKSRSRKMGGTGLGLSIVKHIILLHNGKINVESAYGVGTKLIITLPITQTDK